MKLAIFPLGNPGDKYKKTRHNAARIVCAAYGGAHDKIIGDTYMNESGAFIKNYLKNKSKDVIPVVVYDDKDLKLGDVKLSYGNSSGGHNGVQSVIQHLGPNFYRIRIGVGDPDLMPIHGEGVVQDFVMSNFKSFELDILNSKTLTDKVSALLLEITNKYPV